MDAFELCVVLKVLEFSALQMTTDDGIAYCKRKIDKMNNTLQATEKVRIL